MRPAWKKSVAAVYVEWEDSSTTYGWHNPERDETSTIRSVGILVFKTPKTLTLTTSESQHGRVVDQINIPIRCIRKMRRVKA